MSIRGAARRPSPCLRPRQHSFPQAAHPDHLRRRLLHVLPHEVVVHPVRDVVQGQVQRRQRSAQLVGGVSEEDVLRGDQRVQAFRALVEGAGQGLGLRGPVTGERAVRSPSLNLLAMELSSRSGRVIRRAATSPIATAPPGRARPGRLGSPRSARTVWSCPRSSRRSVRPRPLGGTVTVSCLPQMKSEPRSLVVSPSVMARVDGGPRQVRGAAAGGGHLDRAGGPTVVRLRHLGQGSARDAAGAAEQQRHRLGLAYDGELRVVAQLLGEGGPHRRPNV